MGSGSSPSLFDMEMERLDSEIEKSRRQFYSAVLGKKRKVKRTWLEISSMTNAHILQMLPYKAMLGHVAKLADERDKAIGEILATKQRAREAEMEAKHATEATVLEHDPEGEGQGPYSEGAAALRRPSISSLSSTSVGSLQSEEVKARDEAVQTEESSFYNDY